MKRLNTSQKLIELSTDCFQTMTSDDQRFWLKKPKFVHPGQLKTPNKTWDNIFLRESPRSISLPVRKRDGRRLFRLGTDRALEEVTKTLEQVVPLRKLLASIQKKVHLLSSQVKEKNIEPEEPRKVMSLPGLGIYIVPKPLTSMQSQQLGDATHKRTASYSTYCPLVVHNRPSATNLKEGSEPVRKSPSVCVVDRGTQLSPLNESEKSAQYGETGSDNFIHAEECKLLSPADESNNFLEKPAVATQTIPPAHDSTLDSEVSARHRQALDGGASNCCGKPAVATQTISPPTIIGTSPRIQPQESKLPKKDIDALQISEFPSPCAPPYLQYSQQVASNNYPHSGNSVNPDLFQKHAQTISPLNWNPPSLNISGESTPAIQHPQDWSALNRNVGLTLNNKLAQAQEVYPTPNSFLPMGGISYLPANDDRPNVCQEHNVFPFPEQHFPSSFIERDRPLNIVQPQNRQTVNGNIGFPRTNPMGPLPPTRELLTNCHQQVNGIAYPPYSGNDIGNYLHQRRAATVFPEQTLTPTHFPPLNTFPTQDWYTPNQSINFNQPINFPNLHAQPQNFAQEPEGDIYFLKSRNDIETDSQKKQIVLVQNNPTGGSSISAEMYRGGITNLHSQHRNFAREPEGDIPFSKSRNYTEADSQQKQLVSVQNNPTRDSSISSEMSRGGIVSQTNHKKFGTQDGDVHSPRAGGLVCAPRFGDSLETDPFQLEVIPGVQVTTCPRTPEPPSSKEEVSPMSQMYLKLAEPWNRQRLSKHQKDDQAIGVLPSLLSDPADTI